MPGLTSSSHTSHIALWVPSIAKRHQCQLLHILLVVWLWVLLLSRVIYVHSQSNRGKRKRERQLDNMVDSNFWWGQASSLSQLIVLAVGHHCTRTTLSQLVLSSAAYTFQCCWTWTSLCFVTTTFPWHELWGHSRLPDLIIFEHLQDAQCRY